MTEVPDPQINIPKYEKVLSYIVDLLMGFFILPFVYFIVTISVSLVKSGNNIADGSAIIYIAILTGLMFFLKRDLHLGIDLDCIHCGVIFAGLMLFGIAFIFLPV